MGEVGNRRSRPRIFRADLAIERAASRGRLAVRERGGGAEQRGLENLADPDLMRPLRAEDGSRSVRYWPPGVNGGAEVSACPFGGRPLCQIVSKLDTEGHLAESVLGREP
jgi:hypothetical protein